MTAADTLSCPVCALPVDPEWARQRDRVTHLVCEPSTAPQPTPASAPAPSAPRTAQRPPAPAPTPRAPQQASTRPRRALQSLDDLFDTTARDPADPLGWQVDALCAQTDPELFYPEKGASTAEAKAVCRVCPVRSECLNYALDTGQAFGVWGGMSVSEREDEAERRGVPLRLDDPADDDPLEGPRTLRQHCEHGGVLFAAGYELRTVQTYAARGEFIKPCGTSRGTRLYETRDVTNWLADRRHRRTAS